jgi:hypothetical protein
MTKKKEKKIGRDCSVFKGLNMSFLFLWRNSLAISEGFVRGDEMGERGVSKLASMMVAVLVCCPDHAVSASNFPLSRGPFIKRPTSPTTATGPQRSSC